MGMPFSTRSADALSAEVEVAVDWAWVAPARANIDTTHAIRTAFIEDLRCLEFQLSALARAGDALIDFRLLERYESPAVRITAIEILGFHVVGDEFHQPQVALGAEGAHVEIEWPGGRIGPSGDTGGVGFDAVDRVQHQLVA